MSIDGKIAFTCLVVACSLFSWAYIDSLPPTVLTPDLGDGPSRVPGSLLPQGWAFFTRDGREETTKPYVAGRDHEWHELENFRSTVLSTGWGADRTARAVLADVGALETRVDEWKTCASDVDSCVQEVAASSPQVIEGLRPRPELCGNIVLVRSKPVPFSYAGLTREREARAALLEVSCTSAAST